MLIRPAEAPPVQFGENYSTAQIYSQGFEFAFMSNIEGVRIFSMMLFGLS